MKQILVLHGPNLNLLGVREPEVYGSITLSQIDQRLQAHAENSDAQLRIVQSNHEGVLIDAIHESRMWAHGIIINPGAYGHTSIGLRDAIAGTGIDAIEVHISNVYGREKFRRRLLLAPVCRGLIAGLGWRGYLLALDALLEGD